MINWEKEMDASLQRDDQLVQKQADRAIENLESGHAAHATARSPIPDTQGASLFEEAIAAASARRGVSPKTIIGEDYQQLSHSSYPTPECLTPDELETVYLASPIPDWAKARLQHVNSCEPCRNLFASMHPDAESHKRFNDAMEQAFAERAVAAAATSQNVFSRVRRAATAAVALIRDNSRRNP